MCLERKIEELTAAVNRLTQAMSGNSEPVSTTSGTPSNTVAPTPASAPAPVQETPAPAAPTPAPTPAAAPAPAEAPAPAATGDAPFSNSQELVAYVMAKYKQLGPEKGMQIQSIMTGLGYGNINDIKPEHYAEFHKQVEAIS